MYRTALLRRRAHDDRDTVVANVGNLIDRTRREQIPVVWVQNSDELVARGSEG
jgi:nicotinamidase-related amidase